ncbi:histidine phosphatase family protein [Lacticaseibacillus camelliae]|uniref:histidine phosphatase family protein n=1 Tax=Lacticaseibacillus camelliae TaxID=381742 RepID=UPI0034E2C977
MAQAKQLATYFDSIPLDHAYSSTSERAVDTADLIVHGRLPVRHLKALKEMNYGVFEAKAKYLIRRCRKTSRTSLSCMAASLQTPLGIVCLRR